jgi:predicted CXXCH cytochrome family protein
MPRLSLTRAFATAVGKEVQRMSNHVWRPLLVVVAIVAALLVVRQIYVPDDFGVHANGYSYGWYRQASIGDWKWLPVKYKGKASCEPCHQKQVHARDGTPHVVIECENCHGPATDHPEDPAKLPIDRTRALCLRCHTKLAYPSSARGGLRGIDPAKHHPGQQCAACHDPHQPTLTGLQAPAPHQRHDNQYCRPCHQDQVDAFVGMPHEIVYCETCHGYAGNHPTDPAKLKIDETRALCLTCHKDKRRHNVAHPCVTCHDPHKASLQFLRYQP